MFFCDCLNVKIQSPDISQASRGNFWPLAPSPGLIPYESPEEFFKTALGPLKDISIFTEQESLTSRMKFDKWQVTKCLNCDEFVFASCYDDDNQEEYLINGNLVRNATKLCEMKNCDNYSKPFKIILKQIETSPHSGKINEDRRVKELFLKLQDYIADESSTTETEIRRFNEMQLKLLSERRQRAEREYQMLVNLIGSIGTNSTNNIINNKAILTNDMTPMPMTMTPPITPESVSTQGSSMSIDNFVVGGGGEIGIRMNQTQQPIPQLIKSANNNQRMKVKDANSKHSNVMQPKKNGTTRTFEFDDMFEFDGMNGDSRNDAYQKYSDGEDYNSSDVEKDPVEKRSSGISMIRGKSGASMNFARSAPMQMPLMAQSMREHLEEEDQENNFSIADSIKFLARSVHSDAIIFGELPSRAVMRNIDF